MEGIPQTMNTEYLEPNCYLSVREEVKVIYDENEVLDFKNDLFVISKHKMNREALKDAFIELLNRDEDIDEEAILETFTEVPSLGNVGIKRLKTEFKETLQKINRGYDIEMQKLYGFDFQEIGNGRMAFYNQDGIFVYDRPLAQNERQSKIKTLTA